MRRLDAFANLLEAAVLDQGDGFFFHAHDFGNVLVGKMAVEQQFRNLQVAEIQRAFETIDQFGQCIGKCVFLQLVFFVGPDIPARGLSRACYGSKRIRHLIVALRFVRILNQADMLRFPAAITVDDLAPEQREEICFEGTFSPVILQALYKSDKCFLNDVFGVGGLVEFGLGKTQQPAPIAVDKLRPCLCVAPAYLV